MKKIILLITIFCLISSCVYAEGTIWNCEECGTENNLNFCGNCGSPKDVDISATTSQVHPTPYEAYNEKISEYIAAISMNEDDFIALGGDCHSINLHMVSYARHGRPQLAYVLYDIDYDDIPELVFSDSYSIIDIYTIRDDKLVKVYDDCDYGDRSHLYILPNGMLMTEGANDAFSSSCDISKIDPTTGKVTEPVISYYYDTNGPQDYYVGSLYLETDEYCEIVDFYTAKSIFDNLEWSIIERDSIFTKFFAEAYGDDGAVYAFRLELETARVTDQEIGYPYLNEYDVLYSNGHEASFYVPLNEHNGTEMPFVYGENQDGLYLVYGDGIISDDKDNEDWSSDYVTNFALEIPSLPLRCTVFDVDVEALMIRDGNRISAYSNEDVENIYGLKNTNDITFIMRYLTTSFPLSWETIGIKNGNIVFYSTDLSATYVKDCIPDAAFHVVPACVTVPNRNSFISGAYHNAYIWGLENGYLVVIAGSNTGNSDNCYYDLEVTTFYMSDITYLATLN